MGYTIPGWLDEILDFIGINFPNVDEDDFREMGTAMREFADNFEGKGGDAHQAVTRILSSSQGWAVDAMEKHWSHVKAGHLDKIPELARLFADACDVVADIVYGMKIKAEIELGAMAASVGISLGLAAFTGGLSALLGAAEITAMRQAVKRIVDEAADRIVDELVARVTEPVNAKLEKMVEDAVLDLAEGAFSLPPEPNAGGGGGGTGKHGHGGGMQLATAGGGAMMLASAGGGPGGGVDLFIDHVEFEDGADKVSRHGGDLHTAVTAPLKRAKGHFGRTKGKDAFTAPFESVLEGALKGSEKAVKKVVKHLAETVPDRVKATSRLHKGKNIDAGRRANNVHVNSSKSGDGSGSHHGAPASGRKPDPGLKIDSSKLSQQARELDNRPLCGDPIDMSSRQMVLAQTDADLPGVLPLTLRRTHLSGYDGGRFFGPSWASTLDERLEENKELGGIWWYREDGSILVYPRRPDLPGDRVNPAEGTPLPLTYVTRGTTYVLTTQDPRTGLMRHFEPSPSREGVWWLSGIEDRNGVRRGGGSALDIRVPALAGRVSRRSLLHGGRHGPAPPRHDPGPAGGPVPRRSLRRPGSGRRTPRRRDGPAVGDRRVRVPAVPRRPAPGVSRRAAGRHVLRVQGHPGRRGTARDGLRRERPLPGPQPERRGRPDGRGGTVAQPLDGGCGQHRRGGGGRTPRRSPFRGEPTGIPGRRPGHRRGRRGGGVGSQPASAPGRPHPPAPHRTTLPRHHLPRPPRPRRRHLAYRARRHGPPLGSRVSPPRPRLP
ncbi:DUF6531 domain-containing protein [Streptomyces griseosporeus]